MSMQQKEYRTLLDEGNMGLDRQKWERRYRSSQSTWLQEAMNNQHNAPTSRMGVVIRDEASDRIRRQGECHKYRWSLYTFQMLMGHRYGSATFLWESNPSSALLLKLIIGSLEGSYHSRYESGVPCLQNLKRISPRECLFRYLLGQSPKTK